MITFRARPEGGVDWTEASFSGEDEELLAHAVALRLNECGWEMLVSQSAGEFEPLDEGWLE